MRSVHHGLGGGDRRGGAAGAGRARSAPTTTSTASSSSCRCPTHIDPDAVVARARPGQGRRRADAAQRRAARPRRPGPGALHPRRGDGAARPRGGRAGGRRGGGGRALEAGRRARRAACCWRPNATVTVCHSRTRDLADVCRRADVLVAAVGVPKLLGADAVKPGAVVIDVGMNRTEDGLRRRRRLRGSGRGRGGDHPGPRRRRADDDRDAAGQHPAGRARSHLVHRGLEGSAICPPNRAECGVGSDRPASLHGGRRRWT